MCSRRYLLTSGIVGYKGAIHDATKYVGEDMLLLNYVHDAAATTLSYIDAFRLAREDLMEELRFGKFPIMEVCGRLTAASSVLYRDKRTACVGPPLLRMTGIVSWISRE